MVAEEAKSVRDFDSIFLLRREDGIVPGRQRAERARCSRGWGVLDRAWLPMVADKGDPDDRFLRACGRRSPRDTCWSAAATARSARSQRILLHGLGWGLAATVTARRAGSATYLAWRAQQKIDVFATTLSKVSRGEISEPRAAHRDRTTTSTTSRRRSTPRSAHLQKLIESVNQASSDIAHDLKKPIGRLRRRLELALRNAGTSRGFRTQVVESSLEELDSIVETFEALLRITQIEAGARKARFEPLELGAVLADVADIYEPVVEEAGDRLECSIDLPPRARSSAATASC